MINSRSGARMGRHSPAFAADTVPGMSEPVIRVTAETRNLGDEWEASAYGGDAENPIQVRVTRSTEVEVQEAFIAEWNTQAGTSWAPEEFEFVFNSG
jgi:hypothetical protein